MSLCSPTECRPRDHRADVLPADHDFEARAGGSHAARGRPLTGAARRTREDATVDGAWARADRAGDAVQSRVANPVGAAGDPRLAALGAALSVVGGAAIAVRAGVTGEPAGTAVPAHTSAGGPADTSARGPAHTSAAAPRSEVPAGPTAAARTNAPAGCASAAGAADDAPGCRFGSGARPGPRARVADVRLGDRIVWSDGLAAKSRRWIGALWARARAAAAAPDDEEKSDEMNQRSAAGELASLFHTPIVKQQLDPSQACQTSGLRTTHLLQRP
jgi:hypothetical protein